MGRLETKFRRLIEDHLPWFDPFAARRRNRHTEAIRQQSISTRIQSEKVIDDYRDAAKAADDSAERLIDEVRRGDDR